jgi:glycerol uptake facilitator-like aquaporin
VTEITGTFLLTFLYLTQTEEATKVSKDPAISTLVIAACYTGAILMVSPPNANGRAVLNPAIGLMSPLVSLFEGYTDPMKWFWIYLSFPFVGSILAVIFHEFIYKKMQENVEEVERRESFRGEDNDGDGLLDQY